MNKRITQSHSQSFKATIFYRGGLGGIHALEVRVHDHGRCERPGHRLSESPFLDYTQKGKRKARRLIQWDDPSLVILEGWVKSQVNIPDPWTTHEENGLTVKTQRDHMFSTLWQQEGDEAIEASGVTIVADYRS